MFQEMLNQVTEALKAHDVKAAREALDKAWEHAKAPDQRKAAHDAGNRVQAEIFNQYLSE